MNSKYASNKRLGANLCSSACTCKITCAHDMYMDVSVS